MRTSRRSWRPSRDTACQPAVGGRAKSVEAVPRVDENAAWVRS
jgi:hypothetical protein